MQGRAISAFFQKKSSARIAQSKMLYFIGLGLGDAKDITVRGLEIVKRCEKVFLEHYTSILTVGQEELEKFYEREVNIKFGRKAI